MDNPTERPPVMMNGPAPPHTHHVHPPQPVAFPPPVPPHGGDNSRGFALHPPHPWPNPNGTIPPGSYQAPAPGMIYAAAATFQPMMNTSGTNATENESPKLLVVAPCNDKMQEATVTVAAVAAAVAAASSSSSLDPLRSPATICFERILGAAETTATAKPKKPRKKRAPKKKHAQTTQQEGPPADANNTDSSHGISNNRAAVASAAHQSFSREDPTNPFVEIEENPILKKRLILTMALQRQPKESKGDTADAPPPNLISEGFYWKDYRPLEQLLYDAMEGYYELSTQQRQSKQQQAFNNTLVTEVRKLAVVCGYQFAPFFTDKRLRDRIRCFFKTHLQNAKKRLNTMQKNSHSLEHQTTLRDYIQVAKTGMDESKLPQPTKATKRAPTKSVAKSMNGSAPRAPAAAMPPHNPMSSALQPTANLPSATGIAPSASNTSTEDHISDPHIQSFIPPNADLTPFIPSSADLETFACNGDMSGLPATDSENALPSIYDDDLDHTKMPNVLE